MILPRDACWYMSFVEVVATLTLSSRCVLFILLGRKVGLGWNLSSGNHGMPRSIFSLAISFLLFSQSLYAPGSPFFLSHCGVVHFSPSLLLIFLPCSWSSGPPRPSFYQGQTISEHVSLSWRIKFTECAACDQRLKTGIHLIEKNIYRYA